MTDLRATRAIVRDSSVVVGRDALGNVFVTGDSNTVAVTIVVADSRLRATAHARPTS